MNSNPPPSPDDVHSRHTRRDAETLMLLGGFLMFLAVPVMIGSFWADEAFATVVNLVAGLVLGGIGAGMFLRGRWHRKTLG